MASKSKPLKFPGPIEEKLRRLAKDDSKPWGLVRRCRSIVALIDGGSLQDACEAGATTKNTLATWKREIKRDGIAVWEAKAKAGALRKRGRPTSKELTIEQKATVPDVVWTATRVNKLISLVEDGISPETAAKAIGVPAGALMEKQMSDDEFDIRLRIAAAKPIIDVERKLLARALGEVPPKIERKKMNIGTGEFDEAGNEIQEMRLVEEKETINHQPPDLAAIQTFLHNRANESWRKEIEHGGPERGFELSIKILSDSGSKDDGITNIDTVNLDKVRDYARRERERAIDLARARGEGDS